MAENKNTTENNKNSGIAENNEQLWERIMEKTQDEFLDDSEENSEKIEEIEDLKNDITYEPLITIVESLQAAVEKIPIKDAFDELDSERDYYQEKRKESNDRLIKRKGMIGKVIGFAPMVCLFVGYLIIPLVFIGFTSMSSSFSNMSSGKI